MKRLKLEIICDPVLTDAIADHLVGLYDAGIEVGVEDEQKEQRLQVFFEREEPNPAEIEELIARISLFLAELAEIFQVAKPEISASCFAEEDWSNSWKVHFKPFAIVPGLVIRPSWESYAPQEGEVVLEMDPGMAFGTGHHATTSLCMAHIREVLRQQPGAKVLDVGTGTGILAMASALWGAEELLGIDNDPLAVDAARVNVAKNGLDGKLRIEMTPLAQVEGSFGLVVANIIHDVLVAMADDLARLVASEGVLVLSGILAGEQAANITRVFTGRGFSLVAEEQKGEWSSLRLKRTQPFDR